MSIEPFGQIEIRRMTPKDLDDVLKIERVSFPTPWTRTLFEQELVMPFAKAFIAVEVDSQRVGGYMCFWLAAEEAHILNLAVHPEQRRRGIGTRLLRLGVRYCQENGVEEVTLEVRRSNYQAISLYRNFDFQTQGVRPHYYSDTGEDALVMGLRLADPSLATCP